MYIVNLKGGLGNQLFQYFFSQSLKLSSENKTIKFCETIINQNQQKLDDVFNIQLDWANQKDLSNVSFILKNYFLRKNIPRVAKKLKIKNFFNNILIENESLFYDLNTLKKFKYLDGYWQNQNYFFKFKEEIQSKLKFKNHLDIQNKLNIDKNLSKIAIHIRRGDYLKKKNSNILWIPPKEYYINYINHFNLKFPKNIFIFFSDDIDWVKNNFKDININKIFIDNTLHKGLNDFQLMSQCDHFIISNSTFSWWAAYISKNKNKIIVCPNKWFKNNLRKNEAIIPKDWIRDNIYS